MKTNMQLLAGLQQWPKVWLIWANKDAPWNNSWENNESELTACGCFIMTWDHHYTLKGFSSLLECSSAVMDVFQPQRGGSMLTDVDGLPSYFRGLGCFCECWHNTGANNTRLAPPYVYKYILKYILMYVHTHTHIRIDRLIDPASNKCLKF